MDIYNIRGFVIRAVDYGETSKILTAFTKDRGIISIMARGVKSPKSKKFNLVSVFSESNFELTKKEDLYFLRDGEIIETNMKIRASIDKIYVAQLFFDIIERTSFNSEEENIYELLKKSLYYLQVNENSIRLANMFLIKYISMIGFRPYLRANMDKSNEYYFSLSQGRLLNKSTYSADEIILDGKEIIYLNSILLEVYENIDIIESNIDEKKIFKLIISFINYSLDIHMPQSYINFTKIKGIE